MPFPVLIFSRSDDGDLTKIIVGVVFAALWGLGALISSWNKKVEEEKRRRQQGRLPRDVTQRQYPAQPHAYNTPLPAPVPPPPPAARQRKRRRQTPTPVPAPPPPQVPAAAEPADRMEQPQRSAETSEAAGIARLVHRKDSLRAAIILQEVLAPPLALRDHQTH